MKKLRFAATVTFRSLKRAFTTRPVPLKYKIQMILNSLKVVLQGYVYIEDIPGRAQARAMDICIHEGWSCKYTWFRWKSFNRLAMLDHGIIDTQWSYYINEDELD